MPILYATYYRHVDNVGFQVWKNRRVTSTWQEPQYAYAEDIIEHNKKLLQPPISWFRATMRVRKTAIRLKALTIW